MAVNQKRDLPMLILYENTERQFIDKAYSNAWEAWVKSSKTSRSRTYRAEDLPRFTQINEAETEFKQSIMLHPGMRVKHLWNDYDAPKGSVGVVEECKKDGCSVRFGKKVVFITPKTHVVDEFTAKSRRQVPLVVCATATVYTVQGLTFSDIPVIFNNYRAHKFAYGQGFTAVSRLSDPENFSALRDLRIEDFVASEAAIRFDQYHRQKGLVSRVDYTWEHKSNYFGRKCNHPADEQCMICCNADELFNKTQINLNNFFKKYRNLKNILILKTCIVFVLYFIFSFCYSLLLLLF